MIYCKKICYFFIISFLFIALCACKSNKSAYDLAVENGFEGTLEEWLVSLEGEDGKNGQNGDNGANGMSAYEIAVQNGFNGTVEEWLESLKGEQKDMNIVTYLDLDGESILGTELLVDNSCATKYSTIGLDKEGYRKVWLDKNGNVFDFNEKIVEDVELTLKYELYGSAEIYSEEVLSLIKTPCEVKFAPDIDQQYYDNYFYFAMQAGMEITTGGRLWSCWIAGEDGPAAYMVATYSDDGGETWEDLQVVIDPHSNDLPLIMNVHCGHVWQDPLGRLWIFYQQSYGMWDGEGANFAIVCENPDDENPVWNDPIYISIGASLKKPIITSSGEWLLPVSVWERWHISAPLSNENHELDALRGAHVYASVDQGATWEYRGGITYENSQFNEHSIVELSDGRIMMYSRCSNAIKKSYSSDGGRTWSPEEVAFPHIGSLAVVRKLANGHFVLIKHGTSFDTATSSRSHLTAFISTDDCQTWQGGLLLDERSGISYPEIALASDGRIYVQYDFNRTREAQILFATFTEAEVLAGSLSESDSALKQIVKNTNGIKGHEFNYQGVASFAGGDGTQSNPFQIATGAQFKYIAQQVSAGKTYEGQYFKQTADIDFNGENIVPIGYWLQGGSKIAQFKGNYDGAGYKISNFTQIAPELYSRGLFGYVTGGSIKNVTVTDAFINGKTNTGAIVGFASGTATSPITIENCVVGDNTTVIAYTQVGGVIGRCVNYVSISKCINNAKVMAPFSSEGQDVNIGGIAGYIDNNIAISRCVNNGEIYARHTMNAYIGGICSNGKNCSILYCTNNGNLTADVCVGNLFMGGIASWNSSVTMMFCTNNGDIKGSGLSVITVGGLIGFFGKDSGSANNIITRCVNSGDIQIEAYEQNSEILIGGVLGRASGNNDGSSKVTYCVSIGEQRFESEKAVATMGSFIGRYVASKTIFVGNFVIEGLPVGKASSVSMDVAYLCCAANKDIAMQKYNEYKND